MTRPILPGATIGVLGSGQLGRMFAIAARRMGYRVHTFSPDSDTPTGQVADVEIIGAYDDLDAIRAFARNVDALTFEFENVPAATAAAAAEERPVRPAGEILHTTQNRLREKSFLKDHGFPVTPFAAARSREELSREIASRERPAIVKTASWGYDGKGQVRVGGNGDTAEAWSFLKTDEAIVEDLVDFEAELSVVVARGLTGDVVTYDVTRNTHVRGILDLSVAPSSFGDAIEREARSIAHGIADALDLVGVLCVELFLTRDGRLLVNELAPRPHNSGHWTFDAAVTSQFEQQLRAVCALPLGSPEQLRPAAMANLLGDLWEEGEPNWAAAAALRDVKIHIYGKLEPRPGRKMGHLTAMARTAEEAAELALTARAALRGGY